MGSSDKNGWAQIAVSTETRLPKGLPQRPLPMRLAVLRVRKAKVRSANGPVADLH